MFLRALQGLPQVQVVIDTLEQYATRENSAGRTRVLDTTSRLSGAGAAVAESAAVEAPSPKMGADNAAGRSESREKRVNMAVMELN
jgi:hypothetical protein